MWSATTLTDTWDRIQDLLERDRVVLVGWPHQNCQWDAVGIGNQVMLFPTLDAVCGIRADRFAPLFARMVDVSAAARSSLRADSLREGNQRRGNHINRLAEVRTQPLESPGGKVGDGILVEALFEVGA